MYLKEETVRETPAVRRGRIRRGAIAATSVAPAAFRRRDITSNDRACHARNSRQRQPQPLPITPAPQYQKFCCQQVNCLAVLVQRRATNCHDALMWFRPRRRNFDNFSLDVQDVARTGGPGPGDFSAQAKNAVRESQATSCKKPHSHGGRVPAARGQPLERARLRSCFIR